MPKAALPDWSTIEAEYRQGGLTVVSICKKHGVSVSALMQARTRFGWPSRNKKFSRQSRSISRRMLISRMFAVLEKQISRMENTMIEKTDDKEIALLGQLVRTLEKLVELDAKQVELAGEKAKKPASQSTEMTTLRNKLSQRIGQLEKI